MTSELEGVKVDDEPNAPTLSVGDYVGMVGRSGDYLAREVKHIEDGVAHIGEITPGTCPQWGFGPRELQIPINSDKLTLTHDMGDGRNHWALSRSWPPKPSSIDLSEYPFRSDLFQRARDLADDRISYQEACAMVVGEPDEDDPYRRWRDVD